MKLILSGLVLVAASAVGFIAQDGPLPGDRNERLFMLLRRFGNGFVRKCPESTFGWGWTTQSHPTDPTYRKASQQVVGDVARQRKGDYQVSARLLAEAYGNPSDQLRFFRWACAVLAEGKIATERGDSYWPMGGRRYDVPIVLWLMASMEQPRSIEFKRVRFLLEGNHFQSPELCRLGKAMYLRWPNDEDVAVIYARQLLHIRNREPIDEAHAIANALLKSNSDRLRFIKLKWSACASSYLDLGQRLGELKSLIEWVRRYLTVAPAQSDEARTSREYLTILERRLKKRGG